MRAGALLAALAACSAGAAGLVAACSTRPPGDVGFAVEGGAAESGPPPFDGTLPDTGVVVFEAGPDVPFEASPPQAFLRVANLSPDAPTAGFDFCLAQHGTASWFGPVIATTIGDAGTLGDGSAPAVQFPVVTNYAFPVDPVRYDVEIVAPGGSCSGAVATATDLPSLVAGELVTLAIVGETNRGDAAAPGLAVVGFVDEATAQGATTSVRFLNADPAAPFVDFGTGSLGTGFSPLALHVPFAALPTQTPGDAGVDVDPAGYLAATLPASVELSCHAPDAGVDLATASKQALSPSAVYTIALVGGKAGGLPPERRQTAPSLPQIRRFITWATRVKDRPPGM